MSSRAQDTNGSVQLPKSSPYVCCDLSAATQDDLIPPNMIMTEDGDSNSTVNSPRVVLNHEIFWANGDAITYAFMPKNGGTPAQQSKVAMVIETWREYGNFGFKCVKDLSQAKIRIQFNDGVGCWSYVGKWVNHIDQWLPTMNLAFIGLGGDTPTPVERGVILHEFGHVLGMVHEHPSPSAQSALSLKGEAILECFNKQGGGFSAAKITEQIVNLYNQKGTTNFGKPDTNSIMKFFMPAIMNDQGANIEPNYELSDKDKAFMRIHYPVMGSEDNDAIKKLEEFQISLSTIGFDDKAKEDLMNKYKSDPAGLRPLYKKLISHNTVVV